MVEEVGPVVWTVVSGLACVEPLSLLGLVPPLRCVKALVPRLRPTCPAGARGCVALRERRHESQ